MRGERFVPARFPEKWFPVFGKENAHNKKDGPNAAALEFELSHLIVFAGPVVLAGSFHPIPSRTRSLNSPALMVLRLKAWESKSPPGLQR